MPEMIEMPKLSDTMTEGTLVKWCKQEGDAVESGDVIAEVETDKATMDVEIFESGVLLKAVVSEGQSVPVGTAIAFVGEEGETVDEELLKQASAPVAAPAESAPAEVAKPAPEAKAADPVAKKATPAVQPQVKPVGTVKISKNVKASPLAKKLAKEYGVALEGVAGTGPGGRIVKDDVIMAASSGGGSAGWGLNPVGPVAADELQTLSNMRKTIAKRLTESKTQIPHFYVEMEVDAEPMFELRKQLNASFEDLDEPFKLSFNDFVMKAAANAVRKVPEVNASWGGDTIQQHSGVHLAFGVAIPDGLITPVIRDAQNISLKDVSFEAKALIGKAKKGKLKPEEFTGGTITVSNLGMFGVDRFAAIVNPPQAVILAVGNLVKKPVVNARNEIVPGMRMSITVSADHRVVDGAVAAQYLAEIRRLLETPALLLI